MPRPRSGPRATGPYYCAARNKYRIFIYQGLSPKPEILWFDSEREALEGLRHAGKQLDKQISRRLVDVLEEYLTDKERRGIAKPESCAHQRPNFHRFLADHLEQDISRLTPRIAALVYERAVTQPTQTGKPAAAATHRHYLDIARAFFNWAVRKGYVPQNPFKDVRPVGRPSTGKPQLRLDEATRYLQTAFRLFDEKQDRMALAAVVPLYLGLRPGEVLVRRVRDVDGGGSVLWIDKGKSKNARRHLTIKASPLRERLAKLVMGRTPEEPVFCVDKQGRPPALNTLRRAVWRICKAACIPMVCPHSLRGLWATLSIESGAAESAVAAALGHGSFEMTAKHYAQPEALVSARSARVLDLLSQPDAESLEGLSAEQLAAKLSPGVLAKLLALAQTMPPSEQLPPVGKLRKPATA
jgi:integrase